MLPFPPPPAKDSGDNRPISLDLELFGAPCPEPAEARDLFSNGTRDDATNATKRRPHVATTIEKRVCCAQWTTAGYSREPRPTVMLSRIPLELADQIADYLPDKALWALSLVSRGCYTLFNPSLYRNIILTSQSPLIKTLTDSPSLMLAIRCLEVQFHLLADATESRRGFDIYEALFNKITPGKARLLSMTITFNEDVRFRLHYSKENNWLAEETRPLLLTFFKLRLPQLRTFRVTWYSEKASLFLKGTNLLPFLEVHPTLISLDWDFDSLRDIQDTSIPNLQWYRGSVPSCASICNGRRPIEFLIVRLDPGSSLSITQDDGSVDEGRLVSRLAATKTLTRLELLHPGDYGDWDNCTLSVKDLGRVSRACSNLSSISASVDGAVEEILEELQALSNGEDLHIWFGRDPVHPTRRCEMATISACVEDAIRRTLLPNLPRFRSIELESRRGRWSYYIGPDGTLREGELEPQPE